VSEDSRSVTVVALAPGSAIITVSDDAAGLSATEAVDVLVGGTATIALAEGPVSVQE
jgi:predicted metallo-beta-lactamase superfamily hydrolase